MNKYVLTLAALTLVSPALAQAPANTDTQRNACPPASQEAAQTDACPDGRWASHDETRGDFGNDERSFSLTEKDWNGE